MWLVPTTSKVLQMHITGRIRCARPALGTVLDTFGELVFPNVPRRVSARSSREETLRLKRDGLMRYQRLYETPACIETIKHIYISE